MSKEAQAKLMGGALTISQMNLSESQSVDRIQADDVIPDIAVRNKNQ